jgi:hypothetical protein
MNAVVLMLLAILVPAGFSDFAYAAEPPRSDAVCVRNFFPEGSGINPCEPGSKFFRPVVSLDNETQSICTKVYEDRLCQQSPREYRLVRTADGASICTVNFHQEGIAEYCYSNPKIFSWASGVSEIALLELDRH